jgi:hypothetical protein
MVARDAHAVLILDQAGGISRAISKCRTTSPLLPLQPRSPEANPVENVWQFLRDN